MNLRCIVCLTQNGWDPERPEETLTQFLLAAPAETMRNGNALCRNHAYHPWPTIVGLP